MWRKSFAEFRSGKILPIQGRLSMKSTIVIYASLPSSTNTSVLTCTPQMAIRYNTKNE